MNLGGNTTHPKMVHSGNLNLPIPPQSPVPPKTHANLPIKGVRTGLKLMKNRDSTGEQWFLVRFRRLIPLVLEKAFGSEGPKIIHCYGIGLPNSTSFSEYAPPKSPSLWVNAMATWNWFRSGLPPNPLVSSLKSFICSGRHPWRGTSSSLTGGNLLSYGWFFQDSPWSWKILGFGGMDFFWQSCGGGSELCFSQLKMLKHWSHSPISTLHGLNWRMWRAGEHENIWKPQVQPTSTNNDLFIPPYMLNMDDSTVSCWLWIDRSIDHNHDPHGIHAARNTHSQRKKQQLLRLAVGSCKYRLQSHQCGKIWDTQHPTGEYDLGGMVRSMFRDMLCACGNYNLWFKALPIENISVGGGWGEEATYAMDAKRPNCKPTCFYLSK